ncbi:MAG: hypothetical protein QQW96_09780 [Tychonema bourrellyi B0820]|uniref:Uncharacterized protein n=1 Tax=Tychonema bourrellyi FEM_GT703 TaxID=2040638 RepID=A0A2G4F3J8_9CYAN|nr:hypothetical protein [Tychonema bourrellyi B0820]PHX56332.1 hypothetical protein CP500_005985 [Tychonema bourrellyi FEM_GT703]
MTYGEGSSATDYVTDLTDVTEVGLNHILHHSQQDFYEQAFRPVSQQDSLFVEQTEKPVVGNSGRCELELSRSVTFYYYCL